MERIVLCGKPSGCCPVIESDNKTKLITIIDDNKGKVILTRKQYLKLKKEEFKWEEKEQM